MYTKSAQPQAQVDQMDNLTEKNLKNVLDTNFQHYLKIKNKDRKIRRRDEKKLRRNVNLMCNRQLSRSPHVLLNKTNGNSKSSFLQQFYLQSNVFKKGDYIENLLTFQGLLKKFTSDEKTKKNNTNADIVENSSEIFGSRQDGENREGKIIYSMETDSHFSKNNLENTIINVLPEAISINEYITPVGNSNQKDDPFNDILNQVQCEFKTTDTKTGSKKNQNPVEIDLDIDNSMKRNLRNRTPANYNENLSSFTFCGSTKYKPSKTKLSPINNKTRKINNMSPNSSFDLLNATEETSFCDDKTICEDTVDTKFLKCNDFLKLKKLSKNSKSSFEISLPKSLNTVLNGFPMKIIIDLGALNLHELFLEQNIREQIDRDAEETARAVASLTGDVQPKKSKKNTENIKKRIPKGKSKKGKREIVEYFEQFAYNCVQNEESTNTSYPSSHKSGIVSTTTPDLDLGADVPPVMLSRNEKGEWITTVINTNEILIDNNVMLSGLIDNNQFPQVANDIQLHQPPDGFVFNDSSQRDITTNTTDITVGSYNEEIDVPPQPMVKNHYNQVNFFRPPSDRRLVHNVNLQAAHQSTIPKRKKNINSSTDEILDLTKPESIKQKLKRHKDDIFMLGNVSNSNIPPSFKQKLTLEEYRRKNAASSKFGTTPKKISPDMPILDLDFCQSNESNNNFNGIERNELSSSAMLSVESPGRKVITVKEPRIVDNNCEENPINDSTKEFEKSQKQNNSYPKETVEILKENKFEKNELSESESVKTLEIANSCKKIQLFQNNCSELLGTFNDNTVLQLNKYNNSTKEVPYNKIEEQFANVDEIDSENINKIASASIITESNIMDDVSFEIPYQNIDKSQSNLTTEVNNISFQEKEKNELLDDFLDLRNETLDFDDDSISILGDYDYALFDKGDVEDKNSATNNTSKNINIAITDKEMNSNKNIDYKSFKIPKLSGISRWSAIKTPSQPPTDTIKYTGQTNQTQTPRCWPNNPTNIIKHSDQSKMANFPGTSDVKRSYQNNISASKLFGSPCFIFLEDGVCSEAKCRYPHYLPEAQTIKYHLKQLNNTVIKLAYVFVKQRSKMFRKYAQTFIEIFEERNDKEALSELLIDSKPYECRFSLWKSIQIGLIKCGLGKIDALIVIIERVLDVKQVDFSNIDFLIELILDTEVLYFLNFITIFNNIESYVFKPDFINRLASVYWQTNNYDLQAVLLLVCNKFINNNRDKINLLNPVVIDFVKMSASMSAQETHSVPMESTGKLIRPTQPILNVESEEFEVRQQIHQQARKPNQFQEKKIVCNGENDKIKVQIIQQSSTIGSY